MATERRLRLSRLNCAVLLEAEVDRLEAVDAHDLGAEVGQQHGAHRARADAGQLDDLDPLSGPIGTPSGLRAVRSGGGNVSNP